jgi:GT2 family glycosyltransferase/glycosyltransferase involved in cell wall biosynthesis
LQLSPTAASKFAPALLDKLASAREEVGQLRATLTAEAHEMQNAAVRAEQHATEVAARLTEETQLRIRAEQRVIQTEERLALQVRESANLAARAAQLEAERDSIERDALRGSSFWRLTGPARRLAASLPPSLRRQARRSARFIYWLVTPHRTRERIAYFRSRKTKGSFAGFVENPGSRIEDSEAPLSIRGQIWGRAADAEIRCLKEPLFLTEASFEREIAIFATYSPDGWLKPHVLHYIECLRREGLAVVVIVNTDEAWKCGNADLPSRVDGLFIRQNKGYDFGAWAHVLQLHQGIADATILYLINDSMIGPFDRTAFSNLMRRVRTSKADVIGLIDSVQFKWHLQSFFLAFKRRAVHSPAFLRFFDEVVCYDDKWDTISAYELRLAAVLKRAGLRCESLFHALDGGDTALLHSRELIGLGFPFLKAKLLRHVVPEVHPADCLKLLSERGFDLRLVQEAPTNVDPTVDEPPEPEIVPPPIKPIVRGWPGEVTIRAAAALVEIQRIQRLGQTPAAADVAKDRYQAAKLRVIHSHSGELLAEFHAAMSIWAAGSSGSVSADALTWAAGIIPIHELPAAPAEHFPNLILRRYREAQVATTRRLRLDHQHVGTCRGPITVSILMPVYKTPIIYLERALLSVICQTYQGWELCIVDDGSEDAVVTAVLDYYESLDQRIHVAHNPKNTGISAATNVALEMASGSYIGLLDADDMLTNNALEELVNHLEKDPAIDLLYTDECKIDEDDIVQLLMPKPDWSPMLLTAFMYTGHFSVYRTSIVRQLGGLRSRYDFSQDYDLALRVADLNPRVAHVRGYHYGWRTVEGSAAAGGKAHARESNIAALQDAMDRRGWKGTAIALPTANRALRILGDDGPLVSIIIPTVGNIELLSRSVATIFERTLYRNFEVILVHNYRSAQPEVFQHLGTLSDDPRICVIDSKGPFNFSRSCNLGVAAARGEVVIFYNDDVFVISPEWIQTILECLILPGIGAVAPKLLYRDKKIQHAGMVTGTRRLLGTAFHAYPRGTTASIGLAQSVREVSLLSAACLAMRKTVFYEIGGFDEVNTPREHSDVDLCFKLRKQGYSCVYTPHAELTHVGHVSMGTEDKGRAKEKHDIYLMKQFSSFIADDPYFPPTMRDVLYTESQEGFRYLPRKALPSDVPSITANVFCPLDILIFSHDLTQSGAPRAAFDVARTLRSAGHFVVVASPSDGPYRERLRDIGVDVIVDEVLLSQNRDVFDFARNFDKVICNTIVCWPAVAQLHEVVDVYWYIHETEVIRDFAEKVPGFAAVLKKGVPTWADSRLASKFLSTYDVKHRIIEYGIDDRKGLLSTPRRGDGKVVIGVFGTYERRKGQDLAVEGMLGVSRELQMRAELRFFGRTLPGGDDRNFRHNVERIAGCNPSILFFGEVDQDECLRQMAACDIILVPSRDDALSFVALDALSMGIAVVCSRTTGASEYLEDGRSALILRENTPEEIGVALSRLIADAEFRATLGRGARGVYEHTFTVQSFTKKLHAALGFEQVVPAIGDV